MFGKLVVLSLLIVDSTGFHLKDRLHGLKTNEASTPSPAPLPCDGKIVMLLDTSKALTISQFNNQKTFVGQKLFSEDSFNHFERLSLGYYDRFAATNEFGTFLSSSDVKDYVNQLVSSPTDANLRRALSAINDLYFDSANNITVVIFVSSITQDQVNDAKEVATALQDNGCRLFLVAHGQNADVKLLAQIVGDENLVSKWKVTDDVIPNYQEWFKGVLDCSNL